ncbi:MAG: tetratricopeptide repeat protein, partial [Bacteroides sp.]|nr:tetratricopeptide repeat protein [Bacteroides sp.]
MKRVLFPAILMMVACFSFAQQKNVKEARTIANGTNPDFAKAESLINEALTNPETKEDPNTWNVAGFVQKRINEKEMEKAYLKQPYDTTKAYVALNKMFEYFYKADELEQIPDEKGKVKIKFRKANTATMVTERPNLINGGIHFFNEDDNKQAIALFGTYLDAASNPMFEKENYLQNDTLLPQVAYYATLAAMKAEDNNAILKYAPLAVSAPEEGKYALEILATAYKDKGETEKWLQTLQEGVRRYPDYSFFFGHLIDYYSTNEKYDEALEFANNMAASAPDNAFFSYVKGCLYHNMKDYDNAIDVYKKTIELDPSYAEAYSNLGLIYFLKDQDAAD